MNRRERLLASIIGPEMDKDKAKMLDTTIKFILGDMGMQYAKLWGLEGPGVMVFQPNIKDKSMFYLTLEELNTAKEDAERNNNSVVFSAFGCTGIVRFHFIFGLSLKFFDLGSVEKGNLPVRNSLIRTARPAKYTVAIPGGVSG